MIAKPRLRLSTKPWFTTRDVRRANGTEQVFIPTDFLFWRKYHIFKNDVMSQAFGRLGFALDGHWMNGIGTSIVGCWGVIVTWKDSCFPMFLYYRF